jgi:hypothetical protein
VVLGWVSVQGVLVGEEDVVAGFFEGGLEADWAGGVGVADCDPADDEFAVGCCAEGAVPDGAAVLGGVEVVPVGGGDAVGLGCVGDGGVDPGGGGAGAEDEVAVGGDGDAVEGLPK